MGAQDLTSEPDVEGETAQDPPLEDGTDATVDTPSEVSESADGVEAQPAPPPPTIGMLELSENPANPLSFFGSWRTSEPVSTQVEVDCDGEYAVELRAGDQREHHRIFIMGLWEGASCQVRVRAETRDGREATSEGTFVAGALPEELPELHMAVHEPDLVQPGWTLLNLNNHFDAQPLYVVLIDPLGRIRWFYRRASTQEGSDNDVRTVAEGVLIGGHNSSQPPFIVSWEGAVVWEAAIDMTHDIQLYPDQNHFFYLTSVTQGCTIRGSGSARIFDRVAGELTWSWALCSVFTPPRIVPDWAHINALEPFSRERAFILSARNLNALFRVDLDTGSIEWVMGYAGDFSDGFNGDFEMAESDRFLRQHSPEIQPNGNILLFDNGQAGVREYSRALELAYDVETMRAEMVWEFRHAPDIFTPIWGDVDRLPNGNVLVTFGQRSTTAQSALVEVTHAAQPEVVWEIVFPPRWGTYRSQRVIEPPRGFVLDPELEE